MLDLIWSDEAWMLNGGDKLTCLPFQIEVQLSLLCQRRKAREIPTRNRANSFAFAEWDVDIASVEKP